MENVSASSKFSIETLTEGIKPMNIDKKEFEHREDSIVLANFGIFFRLSELRTNSSKFFCGEFSSISVKFSIGVLREEVKPVVIEKFEFEDQGKWILLTSSGTFGLSKIRVTEQT